MAAPLGASRRFDRDLISWSFEVHLVMRKITFSDRLRYRFDNTLSGGVGPLIGWLALASSFLIAAAAIIVIAADIAPGGEDGSKPEFSTMVWSTLMHALDAGTVDGGSGGIG